MFQNAQYQPPPQSPWHPPQSGGAPIAGIIFGLGLGMALTAYAFSKPAPVAVAAPVAQIDYAAITAAVKAGFPAAPVAAPAPAPAPAAPKPAKRKAAPTVVYYIPEAPRCGCSGF